jgi:hypothetical protein
VSLALSISFRPRTAGGELPASGRAARANRDVAKLEFALLFVKGGAHASALPFDQELKRFEERANAKTCTCSWQWGLNSWLFTLRFS